MFDKLTNRLQKVFRDLRGGGRLSESDVDAALREVRLALLEADVNFQVVKDFLDRVREKAVGVEILESLSPGQQVVKIIRDELVEMLGGTRVPPMKLGRFPSVIMLCGLQGSGKTTTAAKLALSLKKERGKTPLLVPADLARPAAVLQLVQLGASLGIAVFDSTGKSDPVATAKEGLIHAKQRGFDPVIVDTAGRLHVDPEMMDQLVRIKQSVSPDEILYVGDSMTGQDAVRSATEFDKAVGITGVILTKLDGDARGGAAISIRSVTGKPIRYAGIGERPSDLDVFHPDRMVSRILGLGDVLTLIEKVEKEVDRKEAERIAQEVEEGELTFETLLGQLRQMKKLGPLSSLLSHLPKVGPMKSLGALGEIDDDATKPVEAMIQSMTPRERRRPELINASRKRRIARGSGTNVSDVNRLLKQFVQMNRMMKTVSSMPKSRKKALFGREG
jgi:signal recognition particle subunit SRP54